MFLLLPLFFDYTKNLVAFYPRQEVAFLTEKLC